MPYPQGLAYCAGLPEIRGGEFTWTRGVQPSVFRMRVLPMPNLPAFVGNVRLSWDTLTLDFPDCALAPHVTRIYQGRESYLWSVLVYDRRWKWRYPRISGRYNTRLCDGKPDPATKKSLTELFGILFDAMGESSHSLSGVPDVYPEVDWQEAYAARELELLCDWAGLVVYLRLDNQPAIEPLGSGAELPTGDEISPPYVHNQSVRPAEVTVATGPLTLQTKLDIGEAVGIDTDGAIKPIDQLSYKPTAGWEYEWPTLFLGVLPEFRHLAFRSVFRWYRLKGQEGGSLEVPGIDERVTRIDQYELLHRLAEEQADDLNIQRCLEGVVRGEFWPLSDHAVNTGPDTNYAGTFTIRPDQQLVDFEYPVHRIVAGEVKPADLYLIVAYHLRDTQGGYVRHGVTRPVPNALSSTESRVEKRYHLRRVKNDAPVYVAGGDTQSAVEAEAGQYADSIVDTYYDTREADILYGGFKSIDLSGKIAQVCYRWGNERRATTRASMNHEFDWTVVSTQERRRRERLGQLFDKVVET